MTEHPTRLSDVTTVLLDVNETLTDLGPLEAWMREQGLGPGSASAWLASVLRDGLAASLAGVPARFGPLGRTALRDLLAAVAGGEGDEERAAALAEQLPAVVAGLPAHEDVEPGIRRMLGAGLRVATLTNGGVGVARALLERLGLEGDVETISVDGTRTWKPHSEAYLGACDRLGTTPERTALIACHPWDVLGAQRAGLVAVWVPRGRSWPESYPAAQRTAARLTEVLEAL